MSSSMSSDAVVVVVVVGASVVVVVACVVVGASVVAVESSSPHAAAMSDSARTMTAIPLPRFSRFNMMVPFLHGARSPRTPGSEASGDRIGANPHRAVG